MPAAVLFDMDGTLVDTEPYWMATEVALAERYGGTWTHEQAMQMVGNDLITSGRLMRDQVPLPLTAEEIVELLLDGVVERVRESVPWRPGARELTCRASRFDTPGAMPTLSTAVAPVRSASGPSCSSSVSTDGVAEMST